MHPHEHPTTAPAAAGESPVLRQFGPFQLLQLLGRSRRSMVWRVIDSRSARPGVLAMPRVPPPGAAALSQWEAQVRRAARLDHPHLAHPMEIGALERWPYVFYDEPHAETLADRLRATVMPTLESVELLGGALAGLAYAHDGGVVHGDVQAFMLLLGEPGQVPRWIGLELAWLPPAPAQTERTSMDALQLHAQREAARHDVLAAGLLLHQMLCGRPALDEPDLMALADRLPPAGRELVRLPWSTPLPVPDAVRAIANRSTDRQPRQRYRSARGLARALEGWLQAEGHADSEPLALLRERLHSVGALPAQPDHAERVSRLMSMDRERTNELAELVVQDPALAFELLRAANGTQVRSLQAAGNGSVLTVRRAIAMLGLEGVRRVALGLRVWPGALPEGLTAPLRDGIDRARLAGRIAQRLRPAGYDAEVVLLITLLQQVGRLIVPYHFPEEWLQIQRLMRPAPPENAEDPEEPGMSEQAASYAVLGADIDALGAAVLRHWGLDDAVLHMARRLPMATTPRAIEHDDDMLRAVASCANETADALEFSDSRRTLQLRRVAQRYARALQITTRDLQDALAVAAPRATRRREEVVRAEIGG